MANLKTDSYIPNWTIPTRMGIIKKMDGDAQKVGLFLLEGATKTILQGDKSKTLNYEPSYKPF